MQWALGAQVRDTSPGYCGLGFENWHAIWTGKIARVGMANASLRQVVASFGTYRKVSAIGFRDASVYEGFLFIGPPLAVKWVTKCLD